LKKGKGPLKAREQRGGSEVTDCGLRERRNSDLKEESR